MRPFSVYMYFNLKRLVFRSLEETLFFSSCQCGGVLKRRWKGLVAVEKRGSLFVFLLLWPVYGAETEIRMSVDTGMKLTCRRPTCGSMTCSSVCVYTKCLCKMSLG